MIDVATLIVIRRRELREHLSLREIARRTGLSRNTIKKYLRAGTVEPRYATRISPSEHTKLQVAHTRLSQTFR